VRAVCGLPLGPAEAREPTVMVNILGDAWAWRDGKLAGEPNWTAILADPAAKLHLYGKAEPRVGRKMGHFTVRGADLENVIEHARELKQRLQG
jgi:5-(carboxyamino)imidazole ribonucleotide synthase